MKELKEFLYNEIFEQTKRGKAFMTKYNLSTYDIRILQLICKGKCKSGFQFEILPVLDKFKIKYRLDENNINFELLEED